jgi:hypothetical protein
MNGAYLIGGENRTSSETFSGIEAATGQPLDIAFSITPLGDIAQACALAAAAFDAYRETTPAARAVFLEAIATALEARAEAIIARAMLETGLPQGRLAGELGRTTGQLRLFATVVREGAWAGAVIEAALPDRQPLPRPALASRAIPLGPVAVFGASNFPSRSALRVVTPPRPSPPAARWWSRPIRHTPAPRAWPVKRLPRPWPSAACPAACSAWSRGRATTSAPRWWPIRRSRRWASPDRAAVAWR